MPKKHPFLSQPNMNFRHDKIPEKSLTFHGNTGCLIGILDPYFMVHYNLDITGYYTNNPKKA